MRLMFRQSYTFLSAREDKKITSKIVQKTIVACIQNILLTFDSNIKHGLNKKNHTIFTNKFTPTLIKNQREIQQIKHLRNSQFIYNFQSAFHYLRNSQHEYKHKQTPQVILLIGDPHNKLQHYIKDQKVISLEEMCGLFPDKVPLSYRSKNNQSIHNKIQNRINLYLQKQPHISHILYTSHNIKMWDQAIQVILDHQPSFNIIQYDQPFPEQNSPFYALTMQDFVQAVGKCFKIVHHQQLPNVIDLNKDNRHAEWIIEKIKKQRPSGIIIIDEDLVNNKDALIKKYGFDGDLVVEVQRIDEESSLWK